MLKLLLLVTFIALPAYADEPASILITAEERQAIVAKMMELQGVIDKQADELEKARNAAQICWSTFPRSVR